MRKEYVLEEKWASLAEFPNYAISTYGRIIHTVHGTELFGRMSSYGTLKVALYHEGVGKYFLLHHLVAEVFLTGYRPGKKIDFADGDKTNCRADNLRFVSASGLGRLGPGTSRPEGIRRFRILETGQTFRSISEVSVWLRTDESTIYKVLRGERRSVKGCTIETYYE